MKTPTLEQKLIESRPESVDIDRVFTARVMESIEHTEIKRRGIRRMGVTRKETLFMKFKHLPLYAIVLIAIAGLITVSATTYAIVTTLQNLHPNIDVEASGTNRNGRTELTVAFDDCEAQKKQGTTYELKQDSKLSADDGAKALQARCEMDRIGAWLAEDSIMKPLVARYGDINTMGDFYIATGVHPRKIVKISERTLYFNDGKPSDERFVLPRDARIIANGKVLPLDSLKPGDIITRFSPRSFSPEKDATSPTVIFVLSLPEKYYSLDIQSYVTARGTCVENPARSCLQHNSINSVTLIVTNGGTQPSMTDPRVMRNVQGKVVSHSSSEIRLDVGGNVIYTIKTTNDVIAVYNSSTVYGLKSFDSIYAKTSPEKLKIKVGDTLDIYYLESKSKSSSALKWSQVLTISLKVERTVANPEVLMKY